MNKKQELIEIYETFCETYAYLNKKGSKSIMDKLLNAIEKFEKVLKEIEDQPFNEEEYSIYCYSDINGDNLLFVESCSDYEKALEIADTYFSEYKYARVEIINQFGEKVY